MKLLNKKIIVIVGLILLIGLGVAGYFYFNQSPKLTYSTEPVKRETIEETVMAGGIVNATDLVEVGSQATGQVQNLYVKLGESVKKGQLIATIDATQQKIQLKDEEINFQNLLTQEKIRQTNLKQAQTEFDSQKMLYDNQILPKVDFLKAKNALDLAKYELQGSQTQLEQSRLKIQNATNNLQYTRITAPIDGVVVAVVTKQGQTINAAQSSPTIVKLAQIDTVQIKTKFSEADVPKLKIGMPAYFTILGMPNKRFTGKLESLELSPIENNSQSSAVYYYGMLSVPNPTHELLIGMTANVSVKTNQRPNVLTIPVTALDKPLANNRYMVKVLNSKDPKAIPESREITIGLNNKIKAEVLSGLQAGDNVVTSQSDGKVEPIDTGM